MKFPILGLALAIGLTACGGGGGGGSASTSAGGGVAPTAPRSTSGDMLAMAPSRGWNYQGMGVTVSVYTDPTPVNGITTLIAAAMSGSVSTVLSSAANVTSNLAGALGITPTASGPQVVSELSAGSFAAVPGSPILVPNTLTQGQTFSPAPGVSATVIAVGTVPGETACQTPVDGATVQYAFAGLTYTVSYVPGCGITSYTSPSAHTFTLVSVGQYLSIGQLSQQRSVASATMLDTAASVLGLRRTNLPGAGLFPH